MGLLGPPQEHLPLLFFRTKALSPRPHSTHGHSPSPHRAPRPSVAGQGENRAPRCGTLPSLPPFSIWGMEGACQGPFFT